MYLACNDKFLVKLEEDTKRRCSQMIDAHNAKPWWKRCFSGDELNSSIIQEWRMTARVQDARMREQRSLMVYKIPGFKPEWLNEI